MVLDSLGGGLAGQDDLYIEARNHSSEPGEWYTPPDGLTWTMNDRRPVGFNGHFSLYALDSEDALSRKLVWTIHHYQVAPIALVYGGYHWIVVRGFEISDEPKSSGDLSYHIKAFEVNNPWPPVPGFSDSALPLPHRGPPPHGVDDHCGSGNDRGIANEHISYRAWQSYFMTGNEWGNLWKGKYVAICDPDPPADRPGAVQPPVKRLKGNTILTPAKAVRYANAGLEIHKLQQRPGWRRALKNIVPSRPMLVQRLDRIDSYYYIVPFQRGKRSTAAVAVDARFGDYHQTVALPKGETNLGSLNDKKAVIDKISGKRVRLEGASGSIKVRKESFSLYPTLVWRPCLESLSPFWPFHMITVGSQTIFVRVDGKVFSKLNTEIAGV